MAAGGNAILPLPLRTPCCLSNCSTADFDPECSSTIAKPHFLCIGNPSPVLNPPGPSRNPLFVGPVSVVTIALLLKRAAAQHRMDEAISFDLDGMQDLSFGILF